MKTIKNLLFITSVFIIHFSCSKNDSNDNLEIEKESKVVRYEAIPNTENQLLAEAYMRDDDATTFIYGSTDANSDILSVESLSFKETNSDEVYYFILDNFQRVTQIYSEVNGLKNAEVQYFYYPEPGLVNYVLAERNWATKKDKVIHFSTVEIDGENFNFNTLIGKSSKVKLDVSWPDIRDSIILVTAIAVAAGVVYIGVKLKLYGLAIGAAVVFVGAAKADETPITNINPNAPKPPDTVLLENPCANSNLEVTIGVDPGNELYALLGGNGSGYYNFYWSTGETAMNIISSHITAPDDGTYYVLVEDVETGCVAFASTNPIIVPIAWYKGNYTLTHAGKVSDTSYNCGTQYDQAGEFYVYIAKLGTETKVAVYAKSIIAGFPNIYTMASFYPNQHNSNLNEYYTRIDPLLWRDFYGFSFNPTGSNYFHAGFDLPPLRLNEITNTLEDISSGSVNVGRAYNTVEPNANNIDCGFFDNSGNHLYSYDYIYYFKNVSANFIGIIPPNELADYELANMEMILFDNNINRFSSVD